MEAMPRYPGKRQTNFVNDVGIPSRDALTALHLGLLVVLDPEGQPDTYALYDARTRTTFFSFDEYFQSCERYP